MQTKYELYIDYIVRYPVSASVTFTITCSEQPGLPAIAFTGPISSAPVRELTTVGGTWSVATSPTAGISPRLTTTQPDRFTQNVSTQRDVDPVSSRPTVFPASSSQSTHNPTTQIYTKHEMSSGMPMNGVSKSIGAEPNAAGNAMPRAVIHTNSVGRWEIGNYKMFNKSIQTWMREWWHEFCCVCEDVGYTTIMRISTEFSIWGSNLLEKW